MVKCSICKIEGHRSDNSRFHPKEKKTIPIEPTTRKKKQNCVVKLTTNSRKTRREVQSHGFTWEHDLLKNVYGVSNEDIATIKYNSKFDLPCNLNRIEPCNVSIKTTGTANAVCMADCLRLYDATNNNDNEEPYHLVVIFYEQNDIRNMKVVKNIIEINLTNARELLFGKVTRSQLEELVNVVKAVPQKRKPTEEEYSKMYGIRDNLHSHIGAIHLDIKCNSQQSRLQGSFNRIQEFLKENPNRIVARSNTCEFRGGKIASEITSSRRTFNKSKSE